MLILREKGRRDYVFAYLFMIILILATVGFMIAGVIKSFWFFLGAGAGVYVMWKIMG